MNKFSKTAVIIKKKAERAAHVAHINNPIRVHREKKHNQQVAAIIKANGGRMTDEQWAQNPIGQLLNGTHPLQQSIMDAFKK